MVKWKGQSGQSWLTCWKWPLTGIGQWTIEKEQGKSKRIERQY